TALEDIDLGSAGGVAEAPKPHAPAQVPESLLLVASPGQAARRKEARVGGSRRSRLVVVELRLRNRRRVGHRGRRGLAPRCHADALVGAFDERLVPSADGAVDLEVIIPVLRRFIRSLRALAVVVEVSPEVDRPHGRDLLLLDILLAPFSLFALL